MKIVKFYITLGCILLSSHVPAQSQQYTEKDYAKDPVWIQMLDDTTANFFEVEKAYNTYFKTHELPKSEHDMIGEYSERQKKVSKRQQKRVEEDSYLSRQVKKYHRWHEKMLPYVQPDGRILTPSERLAIWQQIKDENNKK
jgi:cytochrome oxidase Cu insertion factor (SCO1/SenC/PrrC family)